MFSDINREVEGKQTMREVEGEGEKEGRGVRRARTRSPLLCDFERRGRKGGRSGAGRRKGGKGMRRGLNNIPFTLRA